MALRKNGLEAIEVEGRRLVLPRRRRRPAPARGEVETPAAKAVASRKQISPASQKAARTKHHPGRVNQSWLAATKSGGLETSSRARDAGPTGGGNDRCHHARDPFAAALDPRLLRRCGAQASRPRSALSEKADGGRVYRIVSSGGARSKSRRPHRRAASAPWHAWRWIRAVPDRGSLDNEIARLRDLDVEGLKARWHTVLRRRAPPHLPRHLLFRILAYRLQADLLGELDAGSRRLLDRIGSGSVEGINRLVAGSNRPRTEVRPGTLLTREWDGHLQRVMVLADGFSWNGKTYPQSVQGRLRHDRHALVRAKISAWTDHRRKCGHEERNRQDGSLAIYTRV